MGPTRNSLCFLESLGWVGTGEVGMRLGNQPYLPDHESTNAVRDSCVDVFGTAQGKGWVAREQMAPPIVGETSAQSGG